MASLVGYQQALTDRERAIYHGQTPQPDGTGTEQAPVRVFNASRRKRWRGAILVLTAVAAAAYLVWSRPPLDFRDPIDIGLVVLTWATFFGVAAVGIERCFEPMPTLAVTPEGLVLFPATDPASIVPWANIRSVGICRFGPKWWPSLFLDIAVDDPAAIARHLPVHLKLSYRFDRWMAGDTSYYRPPADFEQPLAEVVDEIEAWRVAYSPNTVA